MATAPPPRPAAPGPGAPRSGNGGLILTLGILGLLCCQPLGIVAWIMGASDLKKIDRGEISESARGTTKAGMILGIIATVLMIIGIILWIAGVDFGIGVGNGVQPGGL